jgi:hypothetical protein
MPKTTKSSTETIEQPWGEEYVCCGAEPGSGVHMGWCGS